MTELSGKIIYPIKRPYGKIDRRYLVWDCWAGREKPRWVGVFAGQNVTPFLETEEEAIAALIAWHEKREASL